MLFISSEVNIFEMISMIIPRPQFFLEATKVYKWEGTKSSALGESLSLTYTPVQPISGQGGSKDFWNISKDLKMSGWWKCVESAKLEQLVEF